ncbi:MAG: PilZ domain-containing protein [Nitrospirae bacterium]|nr:PilZ domain-containing protein [Nitrospirota bacterium]
MEKREFARVAVELPVSFSGNGVAGGGLVSGLSSRGCTVVSDELILPGTTCALHIQLPAQSAPLKVDLAEVRWAQGRECGLEFVRLRLEEKQRLGRFLSSLQRSKGGGFRQTG